MRGGVTPRSGEIHVGARTSTQDGVVLPTVPEAHTAIGDGCLVGHHAHLECCTVESHCLIGFGRATVNRASIRVGGYRYCGPEDLERILRRTGGRKYRPGCERCGRARAGSNAPSPLCRTVTNSLHDITPNQLSTRKPPMRSAT